MKDKFNLMKMFVLSSALVLSPNVFAEEMAKEGTEKSKSKVKYDSDEGFGGPAETGHQLEDDDKDKYPIFRIKGLDDSVKGVKDWKHDIYEDTGLQFGLDYSVLYQSLSDTTPGAAYDSAASGIARFYGKWELVNKGTANKGSLVFKVDHRHELGDTTPSELGGNAGYLSQTGMLFSDKGGVLVDLNWQQYFNDGNTAIVVGKFDPNDYFDVLGYAIPWTAFSNLDTLLNMSIALPDNSYGVAIGHWFSDTIYVQAAVNDANGSVDTDDPFEEGFDELYKTVEFGYSPSRGERYFKNIHVTLWQMDDRTAYGEYDESDDGAEGIVIGANYTWDLEHMVFAKVGVSDVDEIKHDIVQLYQEFVTVGYMKYFQQRSDLFGISMSHGNIVDEIIDFGFAQNESQSTIESFYRMQLAQNFAVTANIQYLIDPANNTEDDVLVTGIRFRMTL
ncbi:carbohydrate porin [Thalassotalea crassostreae]|uniref:carbohydrate porin n=1 Tax=Thalassotalea crassostreae TaxID=1763536 RepID=UPI000839391E|nr:carbohydrate porin [Thalassotalea crassostreae]